MKKEPTTHEASDDEDGRSFADEEGEHKRGELHVVLICAACVQPALTRTLARRRAGRGGLHVSFSVGRAVPLSGLSGSLFLQLFLIAVNSSTVAA